MAGFVSFLFSPGLADKRKPSFWPAPTNRFARILLNTRSGDERRDVAIRGGTV